MPKTAQYLERFHLALLGVLRPRQDRFEFVLKGGGNLRYFHHSVRYSQDIDLDIPVGSVETVQDAVEAAMNSRPLRAILTAGNIEIKSYRAAKQTQTTQRWTILLEVGLAVADKGLAPTKIEFSYRPEMFDYQDEIVTEYVPSVIVRPHGIRSPLIAHYPAAPAMIQKIKTLVERSKVQSRDIFDLELLFRMNPKLNIRGRMSDDYVRAAISRVYEVTFDAYQSQVVAYLDDDYVDQHDSKDAWLQVQCAVIDYLEAML